MKVVIDHVSGSRRGQRQELSDLDRVSFGRHPSCAVSFDAHRDLDASSRHADLVIDADGIRLVDIGSSNGTFVAGQKVQEHPLELRQPVVIEFGRGGPQASIWVGEDSDPLPPVAPLLPPSRLGPRTWAGLAVALIAAAFVVWQLLR